MGRTEPGAGSSALVHIWFPAASAAHFMSGAINWCAKLTGHSSSFCLQWLGWQPCATWLLPQLLQHATWQTMTQAVHVSALSESKILSCSTAVNVSVPEASGHRTLRKSRACHLERGLSPVPHPVKAQKLSGWKLCTRHLAHCHISTDSGLQIFHRAILTQ